MSENTTESVSEEVTAEDSAAETAPQPALNRAERRALASGKKGAANTNPGFGRFNNGSGAGSRSTPAAQRIQSRGASRGK